MKKIVNQWFNIAIIRIVLLKIFYATSVVKLLVLAEIANFWIRLFNAAQGKQN